MKSSHVILLTGLAILQASARSIDKEDGDDFKLTVLHVNDIHAHIEQTHIDLTRCRKVDIDNKECIGGAGRLLTQIHAIRAKDPNHTLVMNAGDFYQGTVYYSVLKYKPLLELANLFPYTALGLGNHDFDDGVEGLLPFANDATFPILAANLDMKKAPELENVVKKSVVREFPNGQKVGIIGYVTPITVNISHPGDSVAFTDEIEAVREEAKRLQSENVTILIALGHSGYEKDLEMAEKIEELDLVVGGHSHTFLYTGDSLPSIETPEGNYPTYVTQALSKRVVPVVQAYCYSKYLGHLELHFDALGELKLPVQTIGVTNANPLLLDQTIDQDADVLKLIEKYRPELANYTVPVAVTEVDLRLNPRRESLIANVVTNSMLVGEWEDVTITISNEGGIRGDLKKGDLTGEDVLSILPFGNVVDRVVMTGKALRGQFENYAGYLCPDDTCYATFLHVAGLRITTRVNDGNRGHRVEVFKTPCDGKLVTDIDPLDDSLWCDVQDDQHYVVGINSFLARGGSRKWDFLEHTHGKETDYDTFMEYLEGNNPLHPVLEKRITMIFEPNTTPQPSTSTVPTTTMTTSGSSVLKPTHLGFLISCALILLKRLS